MRISWMINKAGEGAWVSLCGFAAKLLLVWMAGL